MLQSSVLEFYIPILVYTIRIILIISYVYYPMGIKFIEIILMVLFIAQTEP